MQHIDVVTMYLYRDVDTKMYRKIPEGFKLTD